LRQFLLTLALLGGPTAPFVLAQPPSPVDQPHKGTNFDPPPATTHAPEPPPPVPEAAEPPIFGFEKIDWEAKETWIKMALLIGSLVLARRAFRQMKGEE
jgi:hypothetical protein